MSDIYVKLSTLEKPSTPLRPNDLVFTSKIGTTGNQSYAVTVDDLEKAINKDNSFTTTALGLSNTVNGQLFYVFTDDTKKLVNGYVNTNGVAEPLVDSTGKQKKVPTSTFMNTLPGLMDSLTVRSDQFKSLADWAAYPAKNKVLASGNYTLDTTLNMVGESFRAEGTVSITMTKNTPAFIFGSEETTVIESFTAGLDRQVNQLTVANAGQLSRGDVIFISDTRKGSWEPSRDYYRKGEAAVVTNVTGTVVTLQGGLVDSYSASDANGAAQLIKPTFKKVTLTGKIDIVFPEYNANCVGILGIQLRDSDFSGLDLSVRNGVMGLVLRRCFNVSGKAMRISQSIDAAETSLGLDYAVQLCNSQLADLQGYFSAERHAVTCSGREDIGSIVNRFIRVTGEILTTGKGGMCAADWHANAEFCTYGGRLQGLTVGGNNNSLVPGTLIESIPLRGGINATVSTINFRELVGFDFDFRNCRIISDATPSTASKGVIDVGGNLDTTLASTLRFGGTLNLSGCFFKGKPDQNFLRLRNASNTNAIDVDVSNCEIRTAGTRPIWIQERPGFANKCNSFKASGLKINPEATELYISTVKLNSGLEFGGTANGTIPASGAAYVDVNVQLPYAIGSAYNIDIQRTGAVAGFPGIMFSILSQTASGFVVQIYTQNYQSPGAAVAVNFQWTAKFNRG